MRTTLLLFLSVFFVALHAQDEESITAVTNQYIEITKRNDLAKTLDYVYPKLYDVVPREKLAESLEAAFSEPGIKITSDNYVIKGVSKTILSEGVKYALVSYGYNMFIAVDEEVLGKGIAKDLLKNYEQVFGKGNVSYNKATKTFTIKMDTAMYAINNPAYDGWKFLERKKGMEKLLEMMIPVTVIEKLG